MSQVVDTFKLITPQTANAEKRLSRLADVRTVLNNVVGGVPPEHREMVAEAVRKVFDSALKDVFPGAA